MVIIFVICRLIFLIKTPVILGGDESYELNVMLQNLLRGDFARILEYVQPHHYFGALIQGLITLPLHLFMPTNEVAIFLSVTFIQSITFWFVLNMAIIHYNIMTSRWLFLSFLSVPVGIIITSISSDTAGNATLALILFLLLDRLITNDDYKKATIISLLAILVDISFIPIAFYILFPHYQKLKTVLFKEKFSIVHCCVVLFLLFEFFIIFKLFQKTLNLGNRISHYNFNWAIETFYQHFLAEHSLLLQKIKPLNAAALGLFLLMFFLVFLSMALKKPLAKKSKEISILSIYLFLYALTFYYLKTDEPYSRRPLAINSEYWQLWFYSTLFLLVININFIKNIKINFFAYLFLTGYSSIYIILQSGTLNNFHAYNLNFDRPNPRPKVDTIANCQAAIEKYKFTTEQKFAAIIGCNAREKDPATIKTRIPIDGLFYFGIGVQNFYRNDLGKNLCLLLNEKHSTSECIRGYEYSLNQKYL